MMETWETEAVGTNKGGKTGYWRVGKDNQMGVANCATWDHAGVLACASTRGHTWVHGPAEAGVCYHQKPDRFLWSELMTMDMLMSEGYEKTSLIPHLSTVEELALPLIRCSTHESGSTQCWSKLLEKASVRELTLPFVKCR
jgi:hypothetical protein